MQISVNSDYAGGTGNPEPRLKCIAKAGFTHVFWCHHWCTDFVYMDCEIEQIRTWLKEYGLKLLDIHGPVGPEKNWFSTQEYMRKAGVQLVANRLRMLRALDGEGVVMMHHPQINALTTPAVRALTMKNIDALRRSLDELMPLCQELKVKIALENNFNDSFEFLELMMKEYPADCLGICYDSGHGNINAQIGLSYLERNSSRLIALHTNDNDGSGDQHQPPYYGTVDWERFAKIIKASAYKNVISFELAKRLTPFVDNDDAFMADAYERCKRVVKLIEG